MSASYFETFFNTPLINGSPKTTYSKTLHDGSIENYSNYAQQTRKQLNYHASNGTDVPSLVHSVVAGVIGRGVNIQARAKTSELNVAFETLLRVHAKCDNFDTTGRFHRDEAFRQIVHFENLNGGVIVRHHYNNSWDIPYRIELVGVDMIDTSQNNQFTKVVNGLKKDRYGRITHIYLYTDTEKTTSKPFSMKNMTYFMASWMSLSQYTAVSRLVTLLPTLDGVLQYADAEVKAALERAKAGVYWSTTLYDTILQALNEEFQQANATSQEKIIEAKTLLEGLSLRGVSATGATPIPVDDKITQIDSKTDSVYNTITNQSQKSMASAMGSSVVSAYKDIEKGNYSSIKGALSQDDETFEMHFDRLQNKVINEYLERLFMVGVQIGALPLTSKDYFADRDSFHKWDVLRQSKTVLDEAKEATARAKNLESGSTTHVREYATRGLDFITEKMKQVSADIELELEIKEAYEKAGLEYPRAVEKEEKKEEIEEKDDKDED